VTFQSKQIKSIALKYIIYIWVAPFCITKYPHTNSKTLSNTPIF